MEDFRFSQSAETPKNTGLQAEWIENFKPNITKTSDASLSVVFIANDKQESATEKKNFTPEERAASLDKDLQDFAQSKTDGSSREIQRFQKAVGKFCDAKDKESAFDELGDTWNQINAMTDLKSDALKNELKEEAANTPGRAGLEANLKAKSKALDVKVRSLPLEESFRVSDILMPQRDETRAETDVRIKKELAEGGYKDILASYNAIGDAQKLIDANKGPREKQLETMRDALDTDAAKMYEQMQKAYIRSTIKK